MDDASSESISGLDRKIMLFTFVTVISIALYFVWYIYCFFPLRRRIAAVLAVPTVPAESRSGDVDLPVFRPRGLAPSLIELIPTFRYSGGPLSQVIDCAICLSEFEDGETGRILPDCRHCFHKDCIDEWLRSHLNCPLCRPPVKPEIRGSYPGRVVVTVGDSFVGVSDPGMVESGWSVTAEALMMQSECRRKSPESGSEPPLWSTPMTEADLV